MTDDNFEFVRTGSGIGAGYTAIPKNPQTKHHSRVDGAQDASTIRPSKEPQVPSSTTDGDFILSGKILTHQLDCVCPVLFVSDVKEFIRRLKDEIVLLHEHELCYPSKIFFELDKLAGKELC